MKELDRQTGRRLHEQDHLPNKTLTDPEVKPLDLWTHVTCMQKGCCLVYRVEAVYKLIPSLPKRGSALGMCGVRMMRSFCSCLTVSQAAVRPCPAAGKCSATSVKDGRQVSMDLPW